ncbi:hypothetical protein OHA77_02775 [Streptosporangium sp. NBC_01639]|uniref:hypothetical protein n=1 Tax=Streptosporangium sp. NBC_01639 TaxID=2975948 RepID=UPI0038706DF0|nr:hypothetical protein OHA77_02775 [Streptosporangium sp. NBC_01639]
MKFSTGLVAVVVVAMVSGCGVVRSEPMAASPSPSPVLCPPAADSPPSGCVTMPSWEQRHAENKAYRQRAPMPEEGAAQAEPVAEALRVRLAGLREKALYGQVYVEEAVRAVAPAKTNVVIRPVDARTGVVFAIEMAGGCVTGFHDERDSEVEVGSYIADGGCLTAPGH